LQAGIPEPRSGLPESLGGGIHARMPRESLLALKARTDRIRSVLTQTYPDAHCELNYQSPLELLIATILSAQCTDRSVNRVTESLFKKYHSAADYAAVSQEELAKDIQSLGLFRNKARSIRAACKALVEVHSGQVPQTLPELTALAGVGRKTANVVLGNAFGIQAGIVVDTHVARLAGRLRLTAATDPVRIEKALLPQIPQSEWTQFSHELIWHGRRRCTARKPDCPGCELRNFCPTSGDPSKR
jgi:endonuclease III